MACVPTSSVPRLDHNATEGINLPVRTVVIAETQRGSSRNNHRRMAANAIGRAGRACKESEGWVVLVLDRSPSE